MKKILSYRGELQFLISRFVYYLNHLHTDQDLIVVKLGIIMILIVYFGIN